MLKNIKKVFLAIGAAALVFTSLTGCSDNKREMNLNNKLNNAIDTQLVEGSEDIKQFELMGTDVTKSGFVFDVNFNGVALLEDDSKAFTTVNYNVDSMLFAELTKDSSKDALYNVFDYIVENEKINSINLSKVNDLSKFNKTIIKNSPSIFEGYSIDKGLVYSLSTPVLNQEDKTVQFNIELLTEFKEGSLKPGVGIGFTGGVGVGVFLNYYKGTFIIQDNYKLILNDDEFAQISENPSLAYELCLQAIENKDESKISITRENVTSVTYNNADMLKTFNMSEVENEFHEGVQLS